jgi:hypothetical protein
MGRVLLIFACTLLTFPCSAQVTQSSIQAQRPGKIVGIVVDEDGKPVLGPSIGFSYSTEQGGTSSGGSSSNVENGEFELAQLPLGKIELNASAPLSGYWHNDASPYKQTVTLTQANPTAHVRLKVGPKPAILVLMVSDRITGKAIDDFMIRTFGADGGGAGTAGLAYFPQTDDGGREVLISPLFDVLLGVTAKGYKNWFYSNPADPSDPTIHLESGERRVVQVTMQPK